VYAVVNTGFDELVLSFLPSVCTSGEVDAENAVKQCGRV
jgi:hypothetical protein